MGEGGDDSRAVPMRETSLDGRPHIRRQGRGALDRGGATGEVELQQTREMGHDGRAIVMTVSHDAPLVAVHAQPVATLTLTDPVDAAALSAADVADSADAHGPERANLFETALIVDPPGPMDVTRNS